MVNITHKSPSLRIAIAQAIVQVSQPETIEAILHKKKSQKVMSLKWQRLQDYLQQSGQAT